MNAPPRTLTEVSLTPATLLAVMPQNELMLAIAEDARAQESTRVRELELALANARYEKEIRLFINGRRGHFDAAAVSELGQLLRSIHGEPKLPKLADLGDLVAKLKREKAQQLVRVAPNRKARRAAAAKARRAR